MVDHVNEEQKPEVQRAVQVGTDLKGGSEQAYNALMTEVSLAQQKYGNDTAGFDKFGQAVAKGLEKSGTLEDMSLQFAKHNMQEIATSDEKHIKAADLNPQFGTNALEKAFLSNLQTNYGDLQHRAGDTWTGNPRTEFSAHDLDKVLTSRQGDRDQVEQVRLTEQQHQREQDKFNRVTADLFKNDGDPNHSLYGVLDGIKSGAGHTDGKISHGDLKRYQEDYAVRAARGDFGFNKENLNTVRTLDREWDGQLGVALRGTSPRNGDSSEQQANYAINLKAAGEAMHQDPENIYASYSAPGSGSNGHYSRVDGDGAPQMGSAPLPDVSQAASLDAPPPGTQSPAPDAGLQQQAKAPAGDNSVAAPPAVATAGDPNLAPVPIPAGLHRRNLDANNRPVDNSAAAAAAPPPGDQGAAAPPPQGDPSMAQPPPAGVPNNDASAQPGAQAPDQRRAPGNAYDDYFGGAGAGRSAAAPGAPGTPGGDAAAPHLHRRHAAGQGQEGADAQTAAPPAAASATDAQPHRRVAGAGAGPDIAHAPDLVMPTLKPGDDPKKAADDYQKAALEHFSAAAKYTVQPGQGWDRIARDTLRRSGQDASNEHAVENYSDQIAKLNGASGRLDKATVLHPNDVVKLHDDAWVKAQVDAAMTDFNKKITDAPATPGGTPAAAAGDPADLFSGARSGEGDVAPAPGTAAAAAPPGGDAAAATGAARPAGSAAAPPGGDAATAAAANPAGSAAAPPGDAAAAAAASNPAGSAAAPPGDAAAAAPPAAAQTPEQIEAAANAKRAKAAVPAPAVGAPAPATAASPPPPGQSTSAGSTDNGLPSIYGTPNLG